MSSKIRKPGKCHTCGWEYPAAYGANICKFCGGSVYRKVGPEPGYCKDCGAYCENIHKFNDGRCADCYYKLKVATRKKDPNYTEKKTEAYIKCRNNRATKADKAYEDWTTRIKNVHTHTLTEDEWLRACKHFGGCAMCGAESIDARLYFIQFKEGGKYNACNIIPACEKCSTDHKVNPNPFRTMDKMLNDTAGTNRGQNRDRLRAIVDYLQARFEEAENELSGET